MYPSTVQRGRKGEIGVTEVPPDTDDVIGDPGDMGGGIVKYFADEEWATAEEEAKLSLIHLAWRDDLVTYCDQL